MILLDTCAAIWAVTADRTLGKRARDAIALAARRRELCLSSITAWEIATLARRGRLELNISPTAFVNQLFTQPGVREISIDREVAFTAGSLPGEFHGDPADRIVVATSIVGGFRLMTRDRRILEYARKTRAFPAMRC